MRALLSHVDFAGPWPLGASRVVFLVPSTTSNCSSLNVFAEMFMLAKSWCRMVSRGFLVHGLDDDGNRVNLTRDVVGKLVSSFRREMIAIEVMEKQSVIHGFSFGHLDFGIGVWTNDSSAVECENHGVGRGISHAIQ